MSQPDENQSELVCYGPMILADHNFRDVACLIYESGPELFTLMFGSSAVVCLTDLVQRSHNRFSHQYIRVAEINQQVVGVAILIPAIQMHDNLAYQEVLKLHQRLRLKLVQRLIFRYVLRHDYPAGSLYIANLAVAAEYRNRGIGRQLLSQCIAEATTAACPIFISVDVHNLRAQKLYESLGFQVVETKAIRFGIMSLSGITVGSRILSLVPGQPIVDQARLDQAIPDQSIPDQSIPDQSS